METVKAVEIGESIKFIESIKALFYFDPYSTTTIYKPKGCLC